MSTTNICFYAEIRENVSQNYCQIIILSKSTVNLTKIIKYAFGFQLYSSAEIKYCNYPA